MNDRMGDFVAVLAHERPRPHTPRLVDGVDERLLEDIRNAPDDEGPRLVWADAVGGERGELVVIQLDLERGGLSPREVIARKKRQRQLLAQHGAEWSGLEGIARRVSFARGFVDAAEIAAPQFLAQADDIAQAAPLLSSLTATNLRADGPAADPIPLLSRLCADPVTRELRGLELSCETHDQIFGRAPGELAVEILVRSGMLGRLRALGSRDVLRMPGIRALGSPRALHGIERLWLSEVSDADAMHALLAAGLPALRSLDLGTQCPVAPVAHLLPPNLTELFGADDLAALAKTAVAAQLEHVTLERGIAGRELAAFPRLRALAIPHLDKNFHDAPALRELAITGVMHQPQIRTLATVLGGQLELLDLRNNGSALRFVNEIKTNVAGELLVGSASVGRRTRSGLLRVGRTVQRSWWDHVTLG